MRNTFEITYISACCVAIEAISAMTFEAAERYALKEAKTLGVSSVTVEQKSFPRFTKIKKLGE